MRVSCCRLFPTLGPISVVLSTANLLSANSLAKISTILSATFPSGIVGGFLDLDEELVPLGELLELAVLEAVVIQGLTGFVQVEGLLKFELNGRPAGEVDPQVGVAAHQLHKGDNAQGNEEGGENKGVFPQTG